MIRISIRLALAIWILGAVPCAAATADTTATQYSLVVPPSALQVGCQGPCDCAITQQPTYGSFDLLPLGSDGLYTYYAVQRYIASFNNGPGAVAIVGSGQYKIGGEVALTQQLTLDLQIFGGPVQHFDSGVKSVTVPFPRIDVSCAVHGFACMDSVLVVEGKPVETTGVPPTPRVSGIEQIRPNPFGQAATIVIDLARAGRAAMTVFDLDGRQVRHLGDLEIEALGSRTVTWNGRRDDGREARAGVYWVRMRWPGGTDGRRVVKLD
jgi:hypothetical protein